MKTIEVLLEKLVNARNHGDATVAGGIFDRLVHNAHRLKSKGESMRKGKTVKTER